jgi:hypothetical protein
MFHMNALLPMVNARGSMNELYLVGRLATFCRVVAT